jgi:hypothetical protein
MSYLSNPTSESNYGVVQIGSNVLVTDGIISIAQDISPNAAVSFGSIDVLGDIYQDGQLVITSVTPEAGPGITVTEVLTSGPAAAFTINNDGVLTLSADVGIAVSSSTGNVVVTNTGVTKLTAGSGISLSSQTGNITISSTGADLINVYGTTTSYIATLDDEYIGVDSSSPVTITLPSGVDGRVYHIKDERGQGSGKITVQPQAGEQIDNANSYVIGVPYQSIGVVFRASKWWII